MMLMGNLVVFKLLGKVNVALQLLQLSRKPLKLYLQTTNITRGMPSGKKTFGPIC